MFDVKLAFARHLLFTPNAEILTKLVTKCKFEVAIGVNGKVWIKTDELRFTIASARAIEESQRWAKEDISSKVDSIFKSLGL